MSTLRTGAIARSARGDHEPVQSGEVLARPLPCRRTRSPSSRSSGPPCGSGWGSRVTDAAFRHRRCCPDALHTETVPSRRLGPQRGVRRLTAGSRPGLLEGSAPTSGPHITWFPPSFGHSGPWWAERKSLKSNINSRVAQYKSIYVIGACSSTRIISVLRGFLGNIGQSYSTVIIGSAVKWS